MWLRVGRWGASGGVEALIPGDFGNGSVSPRQRWVPGPVWQGRRMMETPGLGRSFWQTLLVISECGGAVGLLSGVWHGPPRARRYAPAPWAESAAPSGLGPRSESPRSLRELSALKRLWGWSGGEGGISFLALKNTANQRLTKG